jgi:acetyl-CoA acetyltransferase family protein
LPSLNEAFIVEAVRTPIGRRNGALSDVHPADLAGQVMRGLLDRTQIEPELIEDVILGCVLQVGEQALNVARSAVLCAGLPETIPGVTVDRQCGSGQQAIHFAAQAVMAGTSDVILAGGTESMSRVPMFSNVKGPGLPYGEGFRERYSVEGEVVHQGNSAERIAEKWGLARQQLDELSLRSNQLAARAREEGRFEREIVEIATANGDGPKTVSLDECIRADTSLEALSALKPVFEDDGVVTAGNASQISDGAAAMLLASREGASRLGLRPRARIVGMTVVATDPILMLSGPIPATAKILQRTGIDLAEIDLFEVNEAFASVLGAWLDETGADLDKVNVNGGAIALGHPLGASGARLMVTLLHELERTGGRYGLQTMCEGGGTAQATIIERLD